MKANLESVQFSESKIGIGFCPKCEALQLKLKMDIFLGGFSSQKRGKLTTFRRWPTLWDDVCPLELHDSAFFPVQDLPSPGEIPIRDANDGPCDLPGPDLNAWPEEVAPAELEATNSPSGGNSLVKGHILLFFYGKRYRNICQTNYEGSLSNYWHFGHWAK